jgi:hypothetical protein
MTRQEQKLVNNCCDDQDIDNVDDAYPMGQVPEHIPDCCPQIPHRLTSITESSIVYYTQNIVS